MDICIFLHIDIIKKCYLRAFLVQYCVFVDSELILKERRIFEIIHPSFVTMHPWIGVLAKGKSSKAFHSQGTKNIINHLYFNLEMDAWTHEVHTWSFTLFLCSVSKHLVSKHWGSAALTSWRIGATVHTQGVLPPEGVGSQAHLLTALCLLCLWCWGTVTISSMVTYWTNYSIKFK